MFSPDEDGIYARIGVSQGRFVMAFGVQVVLGVMLIAMAFSSASGIVGKLFIVMIGVVMLVQANRLRIAAKREIWLTEQGVVTNDGIVLAPMDEITEVSRGTFALKPSNGFTVTLSQKHPALWVPGLWWRIGHRVGFGGVTAAGPAKFMAEQIALRIAARG